MKSFRILPCSRSLNHQLTPPMSQQIGNAPTTTNLINRPASAYFNNSNNNNVMNQSPSNPNIPSTQSTSTGNLMQSNQMIGYNQMPSPAQAPHTHISHPNLSGAPNANSPVTNRPPMLPNKMLPPQQQQQGGNFMRESQSQHSLRMSQQHQMMAPSMPNIAHASGYANNIPASQSMQNMNQMPGNYPMYHPQQAQMQHQQHQFQESGQQLSPNNSQHHQTSLLRGSAKMAEMGELLKRQQRNQQLVNGGPMHFANSMDNIHSANQLSAQNFHPQSPQKQLPPTAPKPQVKIPTERLCHRKEWQDRKYI